MPQNRAIRKALKALNYCICFGCIAVIITPIILHAQKAGASAANTAAPAGPLKFADEFDGGAVDLSKWLTHPPAGVDPGGTESWAGSAVTVSGGQAHLVAAKDTRGTGGYSSGILTTFGLFAQTYGQFEIRFRMPKGRGLEPVFRLLPVPKGERPSIDVIDAIGSEPGKALFGNRWGDAKADRDYSGSYEVGDLSAGFHVAAIDWDEEKIVWTVDGVERFASFDGVPHQPMYLAVWLSVGSDKAGEPDAQTRFPATLDIDYVRVFARP
jgi:beta-glucanase (GH16 family)